MHIDTTNMRLPFPFHLALASGRRLKFSGRGPRTVERKQAREREREGTTRQVFRIGGDSRLCNLQQGRLLLTTKRDEDEELRVTHRENKRALKRRRGEASRGFRDTLRATIPHLTMSAASGAPEETISVGG